MMCRCGFGGHQFCLVFTELPGSAVWSDINLGEFFCCYCFKCFFCLFLSFFLLVFLLQIYYTLCSCLKFLEYSGFFFPYVFQFGTFLLHCQAERAYLSHVQSINGIVHFYCFLFLYFLLIVLESLPFCLHYLMFSFIPGLIIPDISDSGSDTCSVSLTGIFFFFLTFLYALWFFLDILGKC